MSNDVDAFVERVLRDTRAVGLCLAICEGLEVKAIGTYGFSNLELSVRTNRATVYKIGSISKHIIAIGILRLVRDGLLNLDEVISAYDRRFPSGWARISVRHLLTHTAGLRRDPHASDFFSSRSISDVVLDRSNSDLLFLPGDEWAYSNLGYYVLAHLIQIVSAVSFRKFFETRIFSPLGLLSTRTTSVYDLIPHRANSYYQSGAGVMNAGDHIAFRPSGAFVSNIEDLVVWDRLLWMPELNFGAATEEMGRPVTLSDGRAKHYGFGWYIADTNSQRFLHHGGGLWGFRTYYIRCLSTKLSVIVLANYKDIDVRKVAAELLEQLFPEAAAGLSRAVGPGNFSD